MKAPNEKRGADLQNQRPREDGDSATRPTHHTPVPVLVVLHADGYAEVFGRDVDAHVVVMPCMSTQQGERLADDYLTLSMPRRYRNIYWPGLLAATGQVEKIRPKDIARRHWLTRLCRTLDTLTAADEEVMTWTC